MSQIQALLENEEVTEFLGSNVEMINEAEGAIAQFPTVLKQFILEHPTEFISESLDETFKNIRVFSEVASSQFITEVTSMYGNAVVSEQQEAENAVEEYV